MPIDDLDLEKMLSNGARASVQMSEDDAEGWNVWLEASEDRSGELFTALDSDALAERLFVFAVLSSDARAFLDRVRAHAVSALPAHRANVERAIRAASDRLSSTAG